MVGGKRAADTPDLEGITANIIFMEDFQCSRHCRACHIIYLTLGGERYFEFHLTHKETKAQRSEITCLPSHSSQPRFKAWPDSQPHTFNFRAMDIFKESRARAPACLVHSEGLRWSTTLATGQNQGGALMF